MVASSPRLPADATRAVAPAALQSQYSKTRARTHASCDWDGRVRSPFCPAPGPAAGTGLCRGCSRAPSAAGGPAIAGWALPGRLACVPPWIRPGPAAGELRIASCGARRAVQRDEVGKGGGAVVAPPRSPLLLRFWRGAARLFLDGGYLPRPTATAFPRPAPLRDSACRCGPPPGVAQGWAGVGPVRAPPPPFNPLPADRASLRHSPVTGRDRFSESGLLRPAAGFLTPRIGAGMAYCE